MSGNRRNRSRRKQSQRTLARPHLTKTWKVTDQIRLFSCRENESSSRATTAEADIKPTARDTDVQLLGNKPQIWKRKNTPQVWTQSVWPNSPEKVICICGKDHTLTFSKHEDSVKMHMALLTAESMCMCIFVWLYIWLNNGQLQEEFKLVVKESSDCWCQRNGTPML